MKSKKVSVKSWMTKSFDEQLCDWRTFDFGERFVMVEQLLKEGYSVKLIEKLDHSAITPRRAWMVD